jgi:hypothetical protein
VASNFAVVPSNDEAPIKPGVSKPDNGFGDGDDGKYFAVSRLRRQYSDYLTGKALEIEEQKEGRHYYHGAQYTQEQVEILRKRRQPIITYNRIGRKINGIVGLSEQQRQDPKAFPRNPNGDEGAQVATQTIRYICDANEWNLTSPECLRQAAIEGIGGIELRLVGGDEGDPDIEVRQVFGDDFFYDPRSARADFSDARYMGIAKWLDVEEAIELFPDKEEELRGLIENGSDLTTYADREFKWIYVSEQRLRLVEHWYRRKGMWYWCFYVGTTLLDQGESPFRDERTKPMARFIMFSAAVDHDGDRYGFVRNFKGPQDEINQRRSKALHISNSKRLIMDKGAVDDIETARTEWARPDGVIEKNPGADVSPDNTSQDLASQFQFLDEAKNEIEGAYNMNPAALAGPGMKNLSGRAVNMLQKPGLAELGPFFISHRQWKIRVYRAMWCAAQQFWTAERWLRVTGDQKVAQFLKINGMELDQFGRPQIVNAIGQLDVDIILDEGPDTVSAMSDTFDVLSQFAPGAVPPAILIELSPIEASVKEELLAKLNPPPDPMKIAAAKIAMQGATADVQKTQSETLKNRAGALSSVASAAHKSFEAHLDAATFARDGMQGAPESSGESGDAPVAPQAPVPLGPVPVQNAAPLPPTAPLGQRLMPTLNPPQVDVGALQAPRRPFVPLPGNGTAKRRAG